MGEADAAGAISTLNFVNDGRSTQAAGVPTQSFGWLFKKGDVPSGSAPKFQVSGVDQPFSASVASIRSFYDDGSLKFCVFALRPTFSLRAGQRQTVSILGGGSWPSNSSRVLTEVYSQSLAVSMPAASPSGANLSGTWGAWCINDKNLIRSGALAPYKDLDGDAGARWSINVKMAQMQGGTAHGQMVFNFFVWALNNSSGNLGGFRWAGCVRQPFYDVDSPSKNWRAFAAPDYSTPTNGPNWSAGGVSATAMSWKGRDGNALTTLRFTTVGRATPVRGNTSVCNLPATCNWWLGGMDGNVIPVYFTTTGTLPNGLNTSTIYFALVFGSGSAPFTGNNVYIFSGTQCNASFPVSLSGGSGTHTIHPIPVNAPFCRTWFKDDNGRYLFFQGGGTITAETMLRAQIDRAYWQSTGLIPPWDLTVVGSVSVSETPFNAPWNPHSIGSCEQDQDGATGVLQCLGILPNDAVLDFYKQNARSERAIRCMGHTWSHIPGDLRLSTTGALVNLSENAYTGMTSGPIQIDNIQWGQNNAQGFTGPPSGTIGMGFTSMGSTEHQPAYSHWAWLRFGEPEYRDFCMEMAVLGILTTDIGWRSTTNPTMGGPTRYGMALSFSNQWRVIAWRFRNLGFAASFCGYDPKNPTTLGPDGTQTVKMLVDRSDAGYLQVYDTMQAANNYFGSHTSRFTARGIWTPRRDFDGAFLVVSPEWEYAYLIYTAAMEAARADSSSHIIDFLNTCALRWQHYITDYGMNGFYGAYAYYVAWGQETAANSHIGPHLNDYENVTMNANGGTISWHIGHSIDAFTDNGVWTNGFSLANNDFMVPNPLPGGLSANKPYYVVNYNGKTKKFGLSATRAGTAITITNTNSAICDVNNIGGYPIGGAPSHDWSNHNAPQAMGTENLLSMRAAMLWGKAALSRQGVYTNQFDSLIADADARMARQSVANPIQNILYSDSMYYSDVRYCYADHFG